MSRRFPISALLTAATAVLAALATTAAAQGLRAAPIPERQALAARIAVMRDSVAAAKQRAEAVKRSKRSDPTDTLVVEGIAVQYPGARLSTRDLAALREGIRRGRAELDARFGAGTASLLDGDRWTLTYTQIFSALPGAGRRRVTFAADRGGSVTMDLPLEPERIASYGTDRAGQILGGMRPAVRDFVGGTITMRPPDEEFYVARRLIATSSSSVARRCAADVIAACRVLFDPARQAQWFEPGDVQRDVARPVPLAVHQSLLVFALERQRGAAVAALRTPGMAGESPVEAIAAAAGLAPDAFLAEWSTALHDAAERRVGLGLPMIATTMAWAGLFAVLALRRGPTP